MVSFYLGVTEKRILALYLAEKIVNGNEGLVATHPVAYLDLADVIIKWVETGEKPENILGEKGEE